MKYMSIGNLTHHHHVQRTINVTENSPHNKKIFLNDNKKIHGFVMIK